MNKAVQMNTLMENVLSSKKERRVSYKSRQRIRREIECFFSEVQMYERDGAHCFSAKNCFEEAKGNVTPPMLTNWEWDTNEIYLGKSVVGKNVKRSVKIAQEIVEEMLCTNFQGYAFHICLSVQFGKFRNIVIRIYLDRGDFYDANIEQCNQPVLHERLQT